MKLLLAYKNFAANRGLSHIGLGVSAINTAKVLTAAGVATIVIPIVNSTDLRLRLIADREINAVAVSAPWIPSQDFMAILNEFPKVRFAVICHSNVGFLQADTNGTRLLREYIHIEACFPNFHLAGNSERFCRHIERAHCAPCSWLPNLYYLDHTTNPHRPVWNGGHLRIAVFGAGRPLKNFMSGAAAALEIATVLRANVELWFSAGRNEGGGDVVMRAVRELVGNYPHVGLKPNGWQPWNSFRTSVSHMHLLLQPSYTESFNMVTADGVSKGVPSVVSEAITWAPDSWKAPVDDVSALADTGMKILRDPGAALDGLRALQKHNALGIESWRLFTGAYFQPGIGARV